MPPRLPAAVLARPDSARIMAEAPSPAAGPSPAEVFEAVRLVAALLLAGLLALTLALRQAGPAEGLPLPAEPAAWACLTA
ncbi:hypothetical protein J2X36_003796 [Methylobacterium sp. BE186]|uniref:hypothetical protein n=1 Tax=Methylobacterium sp. BE186 TaxID=2817715 RepID=UPI0028613EC6|nr:hypothetical protein [Methylobacterium sp. BE186]MDR7039024.1 hypothetical protein [Methylobacterium sp. BE186]